MYQSEDLQEPVDEVSMGGGKAIVNLAGTDLSLLEFMSEFGFSSEADALRYLSQSGIKAAKRMLNPVCVDN